MTERAVDADDAVDVAELRRRLAAAESTLDAIRVGAVDALVVSTADGPRVYTLQGADDFYRALIEQMTEGAAALRSEGTIVYANASLARMIGRSLETVIGSTLTSIVDARDHDRLDHLLSPGGDRAEAHLRLRAGTSDAPLHVGATALAIRDADGESTICLIVSDRTADIEAEAIRRDAELVTDRERVARDLHDNVIQSLFAAGLRLESIRSRVDDAVANQIEQIVDEVDRTIREIRLAIFDLRPASMIADVGKSIGRILAAASHNLGFEAELTLSGDLDEIPDPAVNDLLASLRETLSNAARHADATRVLVDISVTGEELVMRVDDNGRGMLASAVESGLNNLRVRAEAHRGTFVTSSGVDRPGTVVTWRIPLTSA